MVSMSTLNNLNAIHHRFKTVGAALMRANLNNTHSGNLSCCDPRDSDRFWITASGSTCGNLSPEDLVAVRFSDMRYAGSVRPSSEANTHRRVLELPGVDACVHCHAITSTLIGFEAARHPIFLSPLDSPGPSPREHQFQPVDAWGAGLLGAVPVGAFQNTVGSSEMEQRIPAYLRQAPVAIVKGHGPFARGQSLEQCLHHLNVLEHSATVALALQRRGIDARPLQKAIRSAGARAIFAWSPRRMDAWERSPELACASRIRDEFRDWLSYNFDLGLGSFGTGSMSCKLSADEMIFCPMSAAPRGIEVPLQRIPLHPKGNEDAADLRLHRLIYTRTPFKACMLAASPLATAEAMAALAAAEGIDALLNASGRRRRSVGEHPMVVPIDAESIYYKVRLPVASIHDLAVDAGADIVPGLLQTGNGCGLIAGWGVVSAGEEHLGQAAYRLSLAERIARFRQEVDLNHRLFGAPPLAAFE
jgi:ribulose-5-phosphate 4-epimerase/fuculose-1-phosphate aldolase